MKKLCYIATIPAVVHAFLRDHIDAASQKYQVTVVCSDVDSHLLKGINANIVFLPIVRKPSPFRDLLTLYQIYSLFRRENFDIVHSHFPKTGLLGTIAAWLAGVQIRIHTFHGEVWATRFGWRRFFLKRFDQCVGTLATHVLAVSRSQLDFLICQGILLAGKAQVIGLGSICGVDSSRFMPDAKTAKRMRSELGIATDAKVILFVGRLNQDKGILDLAKAFAAIASCRPNVELLLVGSEEDISFECVRKICRSYVDRLHYVNFTVEPQPYMALADVYCLPSYREGFPMTILEAAACGVPAVASRIYGVTDAVADGQTGLLFAAGNVLVLTELLIKMIDDDVLRHQLGSAAKERALKDFNSQRITAAMMQLYDALLESSPVRMHQ